VIMGNTCLYGATGGYLFAAGQAGERFAVRNSGAIAVIEGVGDHACEYMTGGTIVCLGSTGRNFAAGMSGGVAFVLDPENRLPVNLNNEMVTASRVTDSAESTALRKLIELHAQLTESPLAKSICENWDHALQQFYRVAPHTAPEVSSPVFAYDRNLQELSTLASTGTQFEI
jgi:glutamate synthase domain-containing protein 3